MKKKNDEAALWYQPQSGRGVAYDVAKNIPPGGVESPGLDHPGQGQLPKVDEIFIEKVKVGGRALCQLWDNETNKPPKTVDPPDHGEVRVFRLVSVSLHSPAPTGGIVVQQQIYIYTWLHYKYTYIYIFLKQAQIIYKKNYIQIGS